MTTLDRADGAGLLALAAELEGHEHLSRPDRLKVAAFLRAAAQAPAQLQAEASDIPLYTAHGNSIAREPTEAMLNAARDWFVSDGRSIGNEAAIGCWRAMFDAARTPPQDRSAIVPDDDGPQ